MIQQEIDGRRPIANIDIALVRTFVAVVDLGGVARAADFVGRSQPAVSLQLKKLEQLVRAEFFRKSGRNLVLTEAGDVFLSYARRLLEINDESISATSGLKMSGSVRLGVSQDFADDWLTQILARFARSHPSVLIEVKSERTHVLNQMMDDGQIDLALMFNHTVVPNSVDLGKVPIGWVAPVKLETETRDYVPLVLFDPPCEFRRVALEALDSAAKPWRLAFTSPSLTSQWYAVESGLGISVRTPIGLRPGLRIVRHFDGLPPLPKIELNILLMRGQNADGRPARHLAELLQETVYDRLTTLQAVA